MSRSTSHDLISPHALELIAAEGWLASDRERIGEWLLRANNGFTGRTNSCLPIGDPGRPIPAAIDAVQRWYADRGQDPIFQVPEPDTHPLATALTERGWQSFNRTHVMVRRLEKDVDPHRSDGAAVPGTSVSIDDAPPDGWFDLVGYRGGEVPAHARSLYARGDQVSFLTLRIGQRPVAAARGIINQRWLGVTGVTVIDSARRQGHGRQVMRALQSWAAAYADFVYLQVHGENTAAIRMYDALGYRTHHDYCYLRPA